jgi:hypothetical protein
MKAISAFFLVSAIFSTQCHGSSNDAWAELDKQSAKACISASKFLKAKAGPATQFSDKNPYDVRIVSGTYPQKHMKDAKGKVLCLFSRATKKTEVQELAE